MVSFWIVFYLTFSYVSISLVTVWLYNMTMFVFGQLFLKYPAMNWKWTEAECEIWIHHINIVCLRVYYVESLHMHLHILLIKFLHHTENIEGRCLEAFILSNVVLNRKWLSYDPEFISVVMLEAAIRYFFFLLIGGKNTTTLLESICV